MILAPLFCLLERTLISMCRASFLMWHAENDSFSRLTWLMEILQFGKKDMGFIIPSTDFTERGWEKITVQPKKRFVLSYVNK